MADLLVKLYTLPELAPYLARLKAHSIHLRQADPDEKHVLADWVRLHFQESWALGCEVALEQRPVTCFLAVEKPAAPAPNPDPYALPPELLIGFACYDVTSKGMFGPIGVREDYRSHGVGAALLIACLQAMRADRYAYAVIGWAGPVEFYARTVGAVVIEDSEPGIYHGPLVG